MTDDALLIERATRGDSAAFGQLVTRYQDRLYNSLVRLLGSPEGAQDAAQDAFVQAYLKLATFQGHSGFFTWLYRIAFNLAVSARRREKPVVSMDSMREDAKHEPADHAPAPTARLEQAERADQVQNALARLSEEQRAILILREIDECSYEEIAEILNLPVGTIRSRLFRARMQLREQLRGAIELDVK